MIFFDQTQFKIIHQTNSHHLVHEIYNHVFILRKSQSRCPYIHGFSYFLQQALISFHVLKILRPLISKLVVLAYLII